MEVNAPLLFDRLNSFRDWIFTRKSLRVLLFATLSFIVLDSLYLYSLVPAWSAYSRGALPKSSFIERYEEQRMEHRDWPVLRWHPVPLSAIPKYLRRAVIVAEDSRFYDHHGIDLVAFREAVDQNIEKGKIVYGASTISQQTIKNLFLSPSRNPLRKWHELVLTLLMERHLSKARILEIYLNIAEFGRGIYGVEAAAQHYFGKPASDLSMAEAAGLAACLPSPVKSNPATQSSFFVRHRNTILARVAPPKPASDTTVDSLPVFELEAAPTPEEEEPRIDTRESQQHIIDETASTNTPAPPDAPPLIDTIEAPVADLKAPELGTQDEQPHVVDETKPSDARESPKVVPPSDISEGALEPVAPH